MSTPGVFVQPLKCPPSGDEALDQMRDNEGFLQLESRISIKGEATVGPARMFESGATRDTEDNKLDFEGFISPIVLARYAEYMHKHRHQVDGKLRSSDNWQKGIPLASYMKSGLRHVMDWWLEHRGWYSRDGLEDALCGVIFNAMGYLHVLLNGKQNG